MLDDAWADVLREGRAVARHEIDVAEVVGGDAVRAWRSVHTCVTRRLPAAVERNRRASRDGGCSSKKLTSPVGVPLPGALADTVAVYLTSWPTTDGSAFAVTTVFVPSWLTVWVSGDPVVSLAR